MSKYILTIQYFISYKPLFGKYIMKQRLLNIFAWIYLYTIGLILPLKLNKWAKNIINDTNSESQHISGLQNKPTAQWIIKDIKPWNDPQIEKLLHNIFQNKSSVLWGYIYHFHKSVVNLYQHLRKTNQAPHSIVFFELSKDLSKMNKELKNMSFDNQNQASFLLKRYSFFS